MQSITHNKVTMSKILIRRERTNKNKDICSKQQNSEAQETAHVFLPLRIKKNMHNKTSNSNRISFFEKETRNRISFNRK